MNSLGGNNRTHLCIWSTLALLWCHRCIYNNQDGEGLICWPHLCFLCQVNSEGKWRFFYSHVFHLLSPLFLVLHQHQWNKLLFSVLSLVPTHPSYTVKVCLTTSAFPFFRISQPQTCCNSLIVSLHHLSTEFKCLEYNCNHSLNNILMSQLVWFH